MKLSHVFEQFPTLETEQLTLKKLKLVTLKRYLEFIAMIKCLSTAELFRNIIKIQ